MAPASGSNEPETIEQVREEIQSLKDKLAVATDAKLIQTWEERLTVLRRLQVLLLEHGREQRISLAGFCHVLQFKGKDRHYLTVDLKSPRFSCRAELLLDTGFSLDLLLSAYKARQLGLTPEMHAESACWITAANDAKLKAHRYGTLLASVVMEGAPEKAAPKSEHLEVWVIEGTDGEDALKGLVPPPTLPPVFKAGQVAGPSTGASDLEELPDNSGFLPGGFHSGLHGHGAPVINGDGASYRCPPAQGDMDPQALGATDALLLKASPVQQGKDKYKFDAILGCPGSNKLGIGKHPTSGYLIAFHRAEALLL